MLRNHRSTMLLPLTLLLAACTIDATSPRSGEVVVGGSNASASSAGGATSAAGPSSAERTESIQTESGAISVTHTATLPPAIAGCADGTREAFNDTRAFANIAGCMASWSGSPSLRAPSTGAACGDSTPCAAPADACAAGWHVCGVDGLVAELRQVSAEQCSNAGGGRYSAAISHCSTQSEACTHDDGPTANYQCFSEGWCSEPVCCGRDCGEFGACRDGVWPEQTHIPVGQDQGCASMNSQRAGGVLCCRNR